MYMVYTRKNRGVCSTATTVTLTEDGLIEAVHVENGCEGNLSGICALLKNRSAADSVGLLRGIPCGKKATSCPDQIALCLQEALEQQGR